MAACAAAASPEVVVPVPHKEWHYFDSVCPNRTGVSHRDLYLRQIRSHLEASLERPQDASLTRQVLGRLDKLEMTLQTPQGYRARLTEAAIPRTRVAGEVTPAYSTLTDEGFRLVRETLDPKVIFIMRDPLRLDQLLTWEEKRMALAEAALDALLRPDRAETTVTELLPQPKRRRRTA